MTILIGIAIGIGVVVVTILSGGIAVLFVRAAEKLLDKAEEWIIRYQERREEEYAEGLPEQNRANPASDR